jgi:hypothetical protein
MRQGSRVPDSAEIRAAFSSGGFVVQLPARRALPTPVLVRGWPHGEFPLPDLSGVASASRLGFEAPSNAEVEDDIGDSDFVPATIDEEEEYDEQEEEQDLEEEEDEEGDVPLHVTPALRVMAPRPKKASREDVERVEAVFAEFRVPTPRGLVSDLSRRFDVPESTVRFWRRRWVRTPAWRPYIRVIPGNRRIFSDHLEEQMVAQIEETFWRQERKVSRRTFQEFAMTFWSEQRPEDVGTDRPAISNRFSMHFCRRWRLSFRTPAMMPFRAKPDGDAIAEYIRAVRAAVETMGPARVVNMDETS